MVVHIRHMFEIAKEAAQAETEKTNDVANYILDNYGTCKRGANLCFCMKHGWKGQACESWIPLGVKTLDQLLEWNLKNKS